ncbi:hypothetical protein [Nocardiopsis sp. HUAS JQ3]|uniref:hypothetical protein n=1 Tax=Nocardiopsis sp. HUAS JQ3 TaxID=3061629 RepID=UPI0023A93D36|nr:hypothetical protein [Nocardiopsis sp. HUAS JQ3]WDZ88916.1 hypothetical protein PV789_18335 [Nocardiopsis sp. HUAS JQ3]
MILFLNGPVQNGDFTFRDAPGKAVGVHLAEVLDDTLGLRRPPHLWNTVTLSGDLRHGRDRSPAERVELERRALLHKYGSDLPSPAKILTDADPVVAALALDMIDAGLSQGSLRIERTALQECVSCGHMVGPVADRCTACEGARLRTRRAWHLVHDLVGKGSSLSEVLHGHHRKRPRHLEAVLRQTPRRLLLSRTRAHGIRLDALGLDGLALDPRTGLHVTVLAAARSAGAAEVAMTATARAIAHIAAHGIGFTSWQGHRLRYAVHGRIPYEALPALEKVYAFHRVTSQERQAFESRFLPLIAWHNKDRTHPGQLPPLLKYFLKVHRNPPVSAVSERLNRVREEINRGGTSWVMDKHLLAVAVEQPVERTATLV